MKAESYYILDALGDPQPTDMLTWAAWLEQADRQLAQTQIGTVRVSTVFLGLDQRRLGQTPILWETLVFGGPLDGTMYRYETRQQAHAGHEELVSRVRSGSPARPTQRHIDLEE
jgi:hypothetical protein